MKVQLPLWKKKMIKKKSRIMVLLQVDRVRLLVGVGSGGVRTLHVLPEAEAAATPADGAASGATAPGFAELLRKSLGR